MKKESHGMSDTPTYRSWQKMKERCNKEKNHNYKKYGGRGIKIDDRWNDSFVNFYKDIGVRPKDKTLDRIDNNGDYCKENCKWSTLLEQNNNTRTNIHILYNGKKLTVAQWSRLLNIKYSVLLYRAKKDISPFEMLYGKTGS